MVLSKMYCSEQIVIPENISNLLKTYAKGMSVGRERKKLRGKFPSFNVFNIHLHYARVEFYHSQLFTH